MHLRNRTWCQDLINEIAVPIGLVIALVIGLYFANQ